MGIESQSLRVCQELQHCDMLHYHEAWLGASCGRCNAALELTGWARPCVYGPAAVASRAIRWPTPVAILHCDSHLLQRATRTRRCSLCSVLDYNSSKLIRSLCIGLPLAVKQKEAPCVAYCGASALEMSYDEIDIEDMDWSEEIQAFTYQCPCGDLFQITMVREAFLLSGLSVCCKSSRRRSAAHV